MTPGETITPARLPPDKIPTISIGNYQVSVYRQITKVPKDWDKLVTNNNLLLTSAYLEILEQIPESSLQFYYLLFYQNNKLQGVAYLQELDFRFLQTINFIKKDFPSGHPLVKSTQRVLARAGDLFKIRPLICGSAFLTGTHGYFFKAPTPDRQIFRCLSDAMRQLINQKISKANLIFLKDFGEHNSDLLGLEVTTYTRLPFQPAMKLSLRSSWKSFEHYLDAMSSKYRVRAKKAIKMSNTLLKVDLSSERARLLQRELYQLYLEIANNADFNLALLPENYFTEFKSRFPNRFKITGYFDQNKLVGFCTTFLNHKELEAHYLGFLTSYNKNYKIYQDMLYQMIKEGIAGKASIVNFSRTALEIKSAVGAGPVYQDSYLKHTSEFLNRRIPFITQNFGPKLEWKQRHPFKSPENQQKTT